MTLSLPFSFVMWSVCVLLFNLWFNLHAVPRVCRFFWHVFEIVLITSVSVGIFSLLMYNSGAYDAHRQEIDEILHRAKDIIVQFAPILTSFLMSFANSFMISSILGLWFTFHVVAHLRRLFLYAFKVLFTMTFAVGVFCVVMYKSGACDQHYVEIQEMLERMKQTASQLALTQASSLLQLPFIGNLLLI
jgi:hypothetical protein